MKKPWGISPQIFGGESSQNSLVLGAALGITNNNFFQNADNISAQLSWQFLPTSLTRLTASGDYTWPYIGLGHVPLIMGLGLSKQIATISPPIRFIPSLPTWELILFLAHSITGRPSPPIFL